MLVVFFRKLAIMENKQRLTAARIVQVAAVVLFVALLLGEGLGFLPAGAGRACLDVLRQFGS